MSDALSIGLVPGAVSKLDGLRALFDTRIPDGKAVRACLRSFQRKQPPAEVRLSNAVHTLIVAPTGVGKGTSFVVPFLRECTDSCVVIDPKGENAALTMHARRKMGHRCVVLDPFTTITKPSDTFNPLSCVNRDSPTALDDLRDVGEAFIIRTGREAENHWNDSAQAVITAAMAACVAFADPGDCHLQSVRSLLCSPSKMKATIELMQNSPLWDGMLARMGGKLAELRDRELASVMSTVHRQTDWLDTLAIAENTKSTNWSPRELLDGKLTVYLVLPPDRIRTTIPLQRLWVSSLMRVIVSGGLAQRKIHWVLDEASYLGNLSCLESAVDLYRGYGIRCHFFYQSLGQLKSCWPDGKEQTLLSNTTKIFFGINDYQTAELVSNMLGSGTERLESGGTGHGQSTQGGKDGSTTSYSSNANSNWNQHGRKLLEPAEVMQLDPSLAISLTPGAPPILSRLVRYWDKKPHRMGPVKIIGDTLCLFIASLLAAVIVTGVLFRSFM